MRRSRIVRPKGSTRSRATIASGYREQDRADRAAGRDTRAIRHFGDGVGGAGGGQLMAALSPDGLHMDPSVVAEGSKDPHEVRLSVLPTREPGVGDGVDDRTVGMPMA